MTRRLRLGTRGSALALAQSATVADAIRVRSGLAVDLVTVTTEGDVSTAPLTSLGGAGVFAGALRLALLSGEVDLVVHSLKDLPTADHPGLVIAAVPEREDARDALCARDGLLLAELPPGARIGTSSPRRAAQLRVARPDLEPVAIRGNVDTRLRKVANGEVDAVILAAAGLTRLGRLSDATEVFDLEEVPTAPGQGALAVEVRDSNADANLRQRISLIDHAPSRIMAQTEREVLAWLEAGCSAPVGASAALEGDTLTIRACVYAPDGSRTLAAEASTDAGVAPMAARQVAQNLLAQGAADLTSN